MLEALQNVYAIFEQYQISMTGLLIAAAVFSVALLFAVREAASWFFKIDDLKHDLGRLQKLTSQLENEIHSLRNLLSKSHVGSIEVARPRSNGAPSSKGDGFPLSH